jgi:hypothetical protein
LQDSPKIRRHTIGHAPLRAAVLDHDWPPKPTRKDIEETLLENIERELAHIHFVRMELPRFVAQVLCNFSGGLSLAYELVRRQVTERGMWSVVVVVAPPFFEPIDSISHRQEP